MSSGTRFMIGEYSFPPGVLPYKSDGGALCILGVSICGLVPLRVLKHKMTAARVDTIY